MDSASYYKWHCNGKPVYRDVRAQWGFWTRFLMLQPVHNTSCWEIELINKKRSANVPPEWGISILRPSKLCCTSSSVSWDKTFATHFTFLPHLPVNGALIHHTFLDYKLFLLHGISLLSSLEQQVAFLPLTLLKWLGQYQMGRLGWATSHTTVTMTFEKFATIVVTGQNWTRDICVCNVR